MASSTALSRPPHVDILFTGALLVSLAVHIAVLTLLPAWESKPNQTASQLMVELQPPPPKPVPPPEPPKPEPEKPREKPKKPQPKPLPVPRPELHSAPPPPPPEHVAEPPPPAVIAAAPSPAEPPPAFVAPPPPPPPEAPPRPREPSEQDIDAAKSAYGSLLSREFAKHKQYPRVAQLRGWQGVTRVELHLDANGNVTSSSVSESSGYEILDKQALEMVRKASPLPLPPETLRGREFTIAVPVAFRLE